MYLRQRGFTYSACALFTKNNERIRKFEEPGDLRNIYLEKTCFQHDIAYRDLKIYVEEQLLIRFYVIKHLINATINSKIID